MKELVITSSPHIHTRRDLKQVMYDVVISLIPAVIVSVFLFGWYALGVILAAVVSSVVFEMFCVKITGKGAVLGTALDGSAIVTGILLAFNLPPASPLWMVILGSFVAIVIAKQTFGGLGNNIFNPALVARVFLLLSFPVQMTRWTTGHAGPDAVTAATPLGLLKTEGLSALQHTFSQTQCALGNIPGSMGEVSAVALILGALYLGFKNVISWEIPFSCLGTVFVFTGIFHLVDPARYASPLFHIVSGGLILGAFFMATDMVTSPITRTGMLIFGAGVGLLTGIIRLFGGYPEGVSFAILIMNALTPLIDRYTEPVKFGG